RQLTSHSRIHIDENQLARMFKFHCGTCKKRFRTSTILKVHMRTHSSTEKDNDTSSIKKFTMKGYFECSRRAAKEKEISEDDDD
ncbi:hypothetical protein PMAYCL1PPCAC_08098, partial [Pristionchus mayeri]